MDTFNPYLFVFLASIILAQLFKPFWARFRAGRFDWRYLWQSSGMPSGHSAGVSSVTLLIGLEEGFDSALFAGIFVLSFFVLYDAMGVRKEAGEHAHLLNEMMQEEPKLAKEVHFRALKERIGHTGAQVLGGVGLGVIVSLIVFATG